MALDHTFIWILSFSFAYGYDYSHNNCPDVVKALGSGCKISSDCSKIACTISIQGDKVLTWTIKINKCEDPVTVDISVDAIGIHWSKTFSSDERVAVPGLSASILGQSAGVYVRVKLQGTSSLKLMLEMLFGGTLLGNFIQIGDTTKLADIDLPISLNCKITRWWKSIGSTYQILVICGAVSVFLSFCLSCYCCCFRRKSNGAIVHPQPQPPSAHPVIISSTNQNVPMQVLVAGN